MSCMHSPCTISLPVAGRKQKHGIGERARVRRAEESGCFRVGEDAVLGQLRNARLLVPCLTLPGLDALHQSTRRAARALAKPCHSLSASAPQRDARRAQLGSVQLSSAQLCSQQQQCARLRGCGCHPGSSIPLRPLSPLAGRKRIHHACTVDDWRWLEDLGP